MVCWLFFEAQDHWNFVVILNKLGIFRSALNLRGQGNLKCFEVYLS